MTKPFRFGCQSFNASSAKEWREKARRAEELGYSSFLLADHYLGPGPALAATNHPLQDVAAIPAAAVAAEATDHIKVGFRVLCIDNRNAAVLAKELATIDMLSEGRLEIGLGAGWLKGEYDAMGVPFDPPGVRIQRLAETIEVIRAHMGDGEIDVKGEHVIVSGFEGAPKPVQSPCPPIMIGGGGKKVLTLAGAVADIVSLNFNNRSGVIGPDGILTSTAAETEAKLGWIRAGAGDRFDDIEIEVGAYFTFVTDDASSMASSFGAMFGLDEAQMLEHPHGLFGTVDGICDQLEERRARYGISYVTVGDSVMDAFAPVVERLAGR
jgi:probable F420-dependent oxidoreductase